MRYADMKRFAMVLLLVGMFSLVGCSLFKPIDKEDDTDPEEPVDPWTVVATWEVGPGGAFLEDGLVLRTAGWDGIWESVEQGGSRAVLMKQVEEGRDVHLYFDVQVDGLDNVPEPGKVVRVTIEYWADDDGGEINIHYDSHNAENSYDGKGVFTNAGSKPRDGGGQWKSVEFVLTQVRFANTQVSETADFRIWGGKKPFAVRKVIMEVETAN